MKSFIYIFSTTLLSVFVTVSASAQDLFDQTRPDTAIKMIHFPQSLAVFEHTPARKLSAEDSKSIARILKKIDPARIAPAKGILTTDQNIDRNTLAQLGKETESDILLVFRREILEGNENAVKLRIRSLVYFAKQKKVLPLPDQTVQSPPQRIADAQISSFKQLAESARKTILSWKFEKRQSAY